MVFPLFEVNFTLQIKRNSFSEILTFIKLNNNNQACHSHVVLSV